MSSARAIAGARVSTGIGLVLTLALATALAALDLRLYSRIAAKVPPGLPTLIVGLALAAGSFLFLGWRLRRARTVRLHAYRGTLALACVGLVLVARDAVRLVGSDWPVPGSMLLGLNGLGVGAVSFLLAPATRASVVTVGDLETERGDVRDDVETLVAEIQEAYRQEHPVPAARSTVDVIRDGFLRPARAFGELRARPHLELCWIVPLLVVTWPRLTIFAGRDETAATLVLAALDYALWIVLFDAGKAALFYGMARAIGQPLRYASAFAAFMIVDFPSLTTYVIEHVWRDQYFSIAGALHSRIGLAPFVTDLVGSNPALFDALAKIDLVHVWTFALWWMAIATLVGVGGWVALALTLVTFPSSHIMGWAAGVLVRFVVAP